MKNTKKIKLTEDQKNRIGIILAAGRYFEAIKKKTEEENEKWFMEMLEEIVNDQ